MGRFMSPDPIPIMVQKIIDPQQWNMYSYVRNSPLDSVDPDGMWPRKIHEDIILKAFPGLTDHQRSVLMSASFWMDYCPTCQLESNSYQHYMRAPWESASKAASEAKIFITNQENLARYVMGSASLSDASLEEFGKAGHTVMDSTSPAHVDDQGNPLPWDIYTSYQLTPSLGFRTINFGAISAHEAKEATISDAQRAWTIELLQKAFGDTYGQDALQKATVTSPLGSQPDGQSTNGSGYCGTPGVNCGR